MKKGLFFMWMLMLWAIALVAQPQKEPFWKDSFEGMTPLTFQPKVAEKWLNLDMYQKEVRYFFGYELEGTAQNFNNWNIAKPFVVSNLKYMTDKAFDDEVDYTPNEGNQALVSFSSMTLNDRVNHWIISPEITLPSTNGNVVTLWVKSVYLQQNNHDFRVLVSTESISDNIGWEDFGKDLYDSFKPLSKEDSKTEAYVTNAATEETYELTNYISLYDYVRPAQSNEWVQFAFSLDDYTGQTVRIAIQNITIWNTNMDGEMPPEAAKQGIVFMVDNLEVWTGSCQGINEVTDVEVEATDVSAKISWEGTSDKYRVIYGEQWFEAGKGDTLIVEGKSEVDITGLTENTVYDYYIAPYCEDGIGEYVKGKRNTFQTKITPLSPVIIAEEDYYYGFEKARGEDGFGLEGWSSLIVKYGSWFVMDNEPARNGTNCARFSGSTYETEGWLFSRGIYLEEGEEIQVGFYYRTYNGYDGTFEMYIGREQTPEAQTELLWKDEDFDNTDYIFANHREYTGDFYEAPETGVYYVGLRTTAEQVSGYLSRSIYVDDFEVRSKESVLSDQEYEIIYEDSFEDEETYKENWSVYGTALTSPTIPGLDWVESGRISEEDAAGVDKDLYDFSPYSGDYSFLFVRSTDEKLVLSARALGTKGNVVSFMAKSVKKDVAKETFRVYVSIEDPLSESFSGWDTVEPVSEEINLQDYVSAMNSSGWTKFLFNLDEYAAKTVWVVIQYTGDGDAEGLLIDDFALRTGTCDAQVYSANVPHASVSMTSAKLNWDSDAGVAYKVRWGKEDFDIRYAEEYTEEEVSERSLVISGLEANTRYDFYIKVMCAESQESERDWAGPYAIYTAANKIVLPYAYDFENGDYLAEGWRIYSYLDDGSNGWYIAEDGDDNLSLVFANSSGATGRNYIFFPSVQVPYNEMLQFTFDYRVENPSEGDKLEFFAVEKEIYLEASYYQFVTMWENKNLSAMDGYETVTEKGSFFTYTDYDYYFGFVATLSGENTKVFIDNVGVEKDPEGIDSSKGKEKVSLSVYPNPAIEGITIDLPTTFNAEATTIVITDMTGKRIKSEAYRSTVNVTELSSGVYNLTVSDGINRANTLFIKK